ncbi:helix-turn-helix transcriptional regulator [Cellulosimicrobium sp. RS]|uniref:helix-turn-helix transcriptional regulator n=1 Tax=Cellulosimicrobium sp. RS TaxID=3381347 RepID=UPI0038FCA780
MKDLMTDKELAVELGTSPQALADHRYRGTGPAFVKFGRKVRYRRQDVEAFLEANVYERTDRKRSA